jgi:hypothetical protein
MGVTDNIGGGVKSVFDRWEWRSGECVQMKSDQIVTLQDKGVGKTQCSYPLAEMLK